MGTTVLSGRTSVSKFAALIAFSGLALGCCLMDGGHDGMDARPVSASLLGRARYFVTPILFTGFIVCGRVLLDRSIPRSAPASSGSPPKFLPLV
jgi:hypothetical protein